MKFLKSLLYALLTAGALSAPVASQATIIIGAGSLPGGVAQQLPVANISGSGPQHFGSITWTSNVESYYGWTNGVGPVLAGSPPVISLNYPYNVANGGYATMRLTFDSPISGFLAEFFWTYGFSNNNSASMAAYDSANNLLEIIPLSNNGFPIPGISQNFYGFKRSAADIAYINLNNGRIIARNIATVSGPVPEPATWSMMIVGFGAIGMVARRDRRRRAAEAIATV